MFAIFWWLYSWYSTWQNVVSYFDFDLYALWSMFSKYLSAEVLIRNLCIGATAMVRLVKPPLGIPASHTYKYWFIFRMLHFQFSPLLMHGTGSRGCVRCSTPWYACGTLGWSFCLLAFASISPGHWHHLWSE